MANPETVAGQLCLLCYGAEVCAQQLYSGRAALRPSEAVAAAAAGWCVTLSESRRPQRDWTDVRKIAATWLSC